VAPADARLAGQAVLPPPWRGSLDPPAGAPLSLRSQRRGIIFTVMPLSPAFDAGRFAILELIARGRALPDVLDRIVRLIEAERQGLLASILLVDQEEKCLRDGAAPSLPIEYTRLLDGLPIGPKNGSCGTAAHLGEPVIVEDISTHPYWEEFAHLALPHGLRACWSTPIQSPDGTVLGTFAVYYLKPRGPRDSEVELVAAATDLAAVAIGRDRVERSVRRSEARYRQIIDGAHEGIWTTDTSHRTTFANRRMGEILGEPAATLPGRSLLDFVHPDDRLSLEQSLCPHTPGRSEEVEFRVRGADGTLRRVVSSVTPITNEFGDVTGAVGFVRHVRER
jgi:PAS domain S-box-containing protein